MKLLYLYLSAFVCILLVNSVFSNEDIQDFEEDDEGDEQDIYNLPDVEEEKTPEVVEPKKPEDDTVSAEFIKEKYGHDLDFGMPNMKFSKDAAG